MVKAVGAQCSSVSCVSFHAAITVLQNDTSNHKGQGHRVLGDYSWLICILQHLVIVRKCLITDL